MPQTVKWLPKPEKHDFQAAEDYLSLIMAPKRAAEWRQKLIAARNDITHRKAKDIARRPGGRDPGSATPGARRHGPR